MVHARRIAIVTTSRADYGIYRNLARALAACDGVETGFLVSGTHLVAAHGMTIGEIEDDGAVILDRIPIGFGSDRPEDIAAAMAVATRGFGKAFARQAPDLLVALGDRFEMLAAASAALPFRIPLAHLHGGELSFGAVDELIRHAMTKISHLHFVATADYARRVAQMGEEDWRITVSGAPALDTLRDIAIPDRAALSARVGLELAEDPLLVTLHPETLGAIDAEQQSELVLAALGRQSRPIVITAPNADPGGKVLTQAIRRFIAGRNNAVLVESLGNANYFGMMGIAAAMIGNSSSGIIEAASFSLPVVNIGHRQDGRLRARNVIDCAWSEEGISRAMEKALDPAFRDGLPSENPYGDGRAGERIARVLSTIDLDLRLLRKLFVDRHPGGEPQ